MKNAGVNALSVQLSGHFGQRGMGAAVFMRASVNEQNVHGFLLVSPEHTEGGLYRPLPFLEKILWLYQALRF